MKNEQSEVPRPDVPRSEEKTPFWDRRVVKNVRNVGATLVAVTFILAAIAGIYSDTGIRDWMYQQSTSQPTIAPRVEGGTTPPPPAQTIATTEPTPLSTSVPIATAATGETLLLIATFQGAAIHDELYAAIQGDIYELGLADIRVEVEPTIMDSGLEQAAQLGQEYKASFIIWGSSSGGNTEINFLNLEEPELDVPKVTVSDVLSTQPTPPESYAQFVVEQISGQWAFLSYFVLAQVEASRASYSRAIEILEAATAVMPTMMETDPAPLLSAETRFRLGWLYQVTNQSSLAIDNYYRAILLNPNLTLAFINRGIVYHSQGDTAQAIADYNQAIALNRESAHAFYNRGNAYTDEGKITQAITDYNEAINLNPKYADAFYSRGLAHHTVGDLTQAISDYSQAIALDPQHTFAYIGRGRAYAAQASYDLAIMDYDQAITLNPRDSAPFYSRGLAHYAQESFTLAVADFSRAIDIYPQFADAYYHRGNAYFSQGNLSDASADYDQTIALIPGYAGAFINRGLVYRAQGEYVQAIADLRHYLELDLQATNRAEVENIVNELEAELEN